MRKRDPKSYLHTDAPLQKHLCGATSVFSYLKLIIQIIQKSLQKNFKKVLHMFCTNSAWTVFRFPSSNFFLEKCSMKLCFLVSLGLSSR